MALHPISRWGVLALACTALAGCGSSDLSDLQAYVAEIKSRQKGTVAPLPELKPATPFVFNTEDFRDPFGSAEREEHQETAGGNGIRPDLNRPKEELESYALDSLRMVGTLAKGKVLWGLIKAPDGTIHRVRSGNYLGKNYGKVVSVSADRIDLVEIVADGANAWREQPASIALAE
ncbi:pilus assembly protein PilP [Methylogaea oryzae]|uniref:Pilus assembly protein PilP n=1 Tax=Methylogaea oryzae TaxID=1295382 RepID=A0A8D5AP26_9GAMM|nr:pilus assembly protein PilP [Methylogaea oryzae]